MLSLKHIFKPLNISVPHNTPTLLYVFQRWAVPPVTGLWINRVRTCVLRHGLLQIHGKYHGLSQSFDSWEWRLLRMNAVISAHLRNTLNFHSLCSVVNSGLNFWLQASPPGHCSPKEHKYKLSLEISVGFIVISTELSANIFSMSSTDGTQRRTPSGRAPRGTACLDCRRRKLVIPFP